jgi:ribonuclease BN (tRNA processing enzyme)
LPRIPLRAGGKVIGFSGDTEWTDALIDIGHEADLFIYECHTRDKVVKSQMELSMLKRRLGQIRPRRLILTHTSDDMLASRANLAIETAEDGMIIEL